MAQSRAVASIASVDAPNTNVGKLKYCVDVSDTVDNAIFTAPEKLLNDYCRCKGETACQGVMPTVDKYLSNISDNMRDRKVSVIQNGMAYFPPHGSAAVRTLFDTGATDRSYISKKFVNENRGSLEGRTLPCSDSVYLADGKTQMHIDEIILLPVMYRDSKGQQYEAVIRLHVVPLGFDIVIGLPDIKKHFAALLMDMLLDGYGHLQRQEGNWISANKPSSTRKQGSHRSCGASWRDSARVPDFGGPHRLFRASGARLNRCVERL